MSKAPKAPKQKRERAGGLLVLGVIAVLALLVGGGWAAAYYAAGEELPRGAEVAGVDVGSRLPDQAVRAMRRGLADVAGAPFTVAADGGTGQTVRVTPQEAGLTLDYEATIEQAGGGTSWDPRRLWEHYTGGDELDPVVEVDEDRLAAVVDKVNARLGTPPVDGAVSFTDQGVARTEPVTGQGVDPAELRDALLAAYLDTEDRTVEVTLHEVQPDIDGADVQAAVDGFANPAMASPVTLTFGTSPVQLSPQEYADVLSLAPEGGALVPTLDSGKLQALVSSKLAADASAPVDATVQLVDGKPKVIPAKPGVTYAPTDVERIFLDLVARPEGQRQLEVPATVAEPEFTTKDARALRIKRKISSFTTYFPYAEYRNVNIGRAAELLDGTLVKPGETFSYNDTIGERTEAKGFVPGWTIQNGVFKEDLGGGVSQLATTTYNAGFFGGMTDVEHKAHSLYIDRYPVGREATVAWGSVDLRFRNDTPYGVLITTRFTPSTGSSQGAVTVELWSTKVWDITTTTSPRYNFTDYTTRYNTDESCQATSGAQGFTVDVVRNFHKPGSDAVEKSETITTTYIPTDTVICGPPPKKKQPRPVG